MKIWLSGSQGFIGSCLQVYLKGEEHQVQAWDHRSTKIQIEPGTEAMIHLAGLKGTHCSRHPFEAVRANILLAKRVADAAKQAGVRRLIFSSTFQIYGRHRPGQAVCDETAPLHPMNHYGWTKRIAEILIQTFPFDLAILRLGHVYGAGLKQEAEPDDVISRWIQKAARTETLKVHAGGKAWLDPLHVEDVCRAISLVLSDPRPHREIWNLTGGAPLQTGDAARLIQRVAAEYGVAVQLLQEPARSLSVSNAVADSSRFRSRFASFSPRPLEQGIRQVWSQLRQEVPESTAALG